MKKKVVQILKPLPKVFQILNLLFPKSLETFYPPPPRPHLQLHFLPKPPSATAISHPNPHYVARKGANLPLMSQAKAPMSSSKPWNTNASLMSLLTLAALPWRSTKLSPTPKSSETSSPGYHYLGGDESIVGNSTWALDIDDWIGVDIDVIEIIIFIEEIFPKRSEIEVRIGEEEEGDLELGIGPS